MDNQIARYAKGVERPRTQADREAAREAKEVFNEAQLTGLKIEGVIAVAGHAMQVVDQLDERRRDLAQADPTKNQLLSDIELEAVRQIKKLQAKLFNDFGI